jgi:hypothetical protein
MAHPYMRIWKGVKDERGYLGQGQGTAGRRISNVCKESRESRAALVRIKCFGAFQTGVK